MKRLRQLVIVVDLHLDIQISSKYTGTPSTPRSISLAVQFGNWIEYTKSRLSGRRSEKRENQSVCACTSKQLFDSLYVFEKVQSCAVAIFLAIYYHICLFIRFRKIQREANLGRNWPTSSRHYTICQPAPGSV